MRQVPSRRQAVRVQPHAPQSAALALDWLVGRPLVSRALGVLLRFPHALLVVAAAGGISLVALELQPLLFGQGMVVRAQVVEQLAPPPAATPALAEEGETVIAVIAAYNQASIGAGLLGRSDLLAPYLTPDGEAWQQVQAEFARRAQRGETSDASLVRWGVLSSVVAGDTALIETQEQWDVITSVGPSVVSSRRGALVRNRYHLRRTAAGAWQIAEVETTPVIA
jgi:hypothetical protein